MFTDMLGSSNTMELATSKEEHTENEPYESEGARLVKLARDIREGKARTISLEQLEVELGLDKVPVDHSVLDEIQ